MAAQQATWKKGLATGATLVIAGARPEDAAWLTDLAGKKVRITVPRYRMWEGRGYRDGFDALTSGLSHLDLFWKRYDVQHDTADNPEFIIEQLQHSSVDMDGGRELVFPGALVEAKVGEGRLILDHAPLVHRP